MSVALVSELENEATYEELFSYLNTIQSKTTLSEKYLNFHYFKNCDVSVHQKEYHPVHLHLC